MRASPTSSASTSPTCAASATAAAPTCGTANVNGWLHGNDLAGIGPDDRKFLVRLFQAGGDETGVCRALMTSGSCSLARTGRSA